MVTKRKNVLCYGDSNTWGYIPGSIDFNTMQVKRYDETERWTGRLQSLFEGNINIIEEGLNGRTTNIEEDDAPGRNGKTYLLPCLYSHAPLDLVILWLGVNDFKIASNRTAYETANGLDGLIRMIQTSSAGPDMLRSPDVLLIGYPQVANENWRDASNKTVFSGAIVKSKQYIDLCREIADKRECHYIDMDAHIQLTDIDGIHLGASEHAMVADLLFDKLSGILSVD